MRVIAGTARSLPLKTVPGLSTRPTTDRIKETLFNILQNSLYDCRFLDLFAGSGAIGIEALSRGAKRAVFIEKNPAAVKCISDNLRFTKLQEKAAVLKTDVLSGIRRLEDTGEEAFSVIFMDPPYGDGFVEKVLSVLQDSPLVNRETLIVCEESMQFDPSVLSNLSFEIVRDKKYKTNRHLFLRKKSLEATENR